MGEVLYEFLQFEISELSPKKCENWIDRPRPIQARKVCYLEKYSMENGRIYHF